MTNQIYNTSGDPLYAYKATLTEYEDPNTGDVMSVQAKLDSIVVNPSSTPAGEFRPEDYGAEADGVTDDSAAIDAAAAAALAESGAQYGKSGGILLFTPGKSYACTSGITIKCNVMGIGAELVFPIDFAGTAVTLGGDSEILEKKVMWLPLVRCTRTSYANWNATPNSIGILLHSGQYCEVHVDGVRNFAKGIDLSAANGYFCGYNTIHVGMMLDNKVQINIENKDTNAQSWINENRFYGEGRMSHSSNFGTSQPNVRSVRIKQYATPAVTTTTQTLSIVQSTKVITWSGGDFAAAGFYVGGQIVMSGWANSASNGSFRVGAVGTTTLTLASNETVGGDETNRANVTVAMEGTPFGSIPDNNNFYGMTFESECADGMIEIRGGLLNNFYGCRFEKTGTADVFLFGMSSSSAVCQANGFYGGYTNSAVDLNLTTNSWATGNTVYMSRRMASSSTGDYGVIQLYNMGSDTKPGVTFWGNAAGDKVIFKPTGTTWMGQLGAYYWDLKSAAATLPRLRFAGQSGEIYFGDGTTALGSNKLTVFGANTGIQQTAGWFVTAGTAGNCLRVTTPVANATVATTLGSVGPTGAQTTVQGWVRININGTDRYMPFW